MDISQMRMLLTLSECQSMTVTARKLKMTQPALTYRINNIEEELGFKLFDRSRSGTLPTKEGDFFCESISKIIAEYDEAVRIAYLMSLEKERKRIRVGVSSASREMATLFTRLNEDILPGVEFTLIPCGISDPTSLLRDGVIDLWSCSDIITDEPQNADLDFGMVFEVRSFVYLKEDHPLAHRSRIGVDDLTGETIWVWPERKVSRVTDYIRSQARARRLEMNFRDFNEDTPVMLSVLEDNTLAIYDEGYLTSLPSYVICRPFQPTIIDNIGFAYLKSNRNQMEPIVSEIAAYYRHSPIDPTMGVFAQAGRMMTALDEIAKTVRHGDAKDVTPLVNDALDIGVSAKQILDHGLVAGMYSVSEGYRKGDVRVDELLASVNTVNIGNALLQPTLAKEKTTPSIGEAVIGSVEQDMHEAGKNLVRIMLESKGINVTDLGTNVSPEAFVDFVRQNQACSIVLLSASRSESVDSVRRTIDALVAADLRDHLFIMIGGSAVDEHTATQLGADYYTSDAMGAANTAARILSL